MALTRAQVLSGDSGQGVVLPGQVQGVSQGDGVTISSNGQISVDAASTTGIVKLNNPTAYNAYVWPNVDGAANQFLQTDGSGNLSWGDATGFAVVTVSTTSPTPPNEGALWYDCTTGALKVYQTCTAPGGWTTVSEPGLEVDPANVTASPNFVSGSGILSDPYVIAPISVGIGGEAVVLYATVTGLAPFQYVPIVDLNSIANGGRFRATNNYADAGGTLVFQVVFKDAPPSTSGNAYTLNLKIGYSSAYVTGIVNMVNTLVVSPGYISGNPAVGSTLTYTQGSASGGAGGYTYSYVWKDSNNFTLASDVTTYVVTSSDIGKSIYVVLTATDSSGSTASASTAPVGPVNKPPFPNPTQPVFPTVIGQEASFLWDGGDVTLYSSGCIEFKVGAGGTYGQGSQAVVPGQTVYTRWLTTSVCGGAANGTAISGILESATNAAAAYLTIDRVPSAFAFVPATNVPLGTVATSTPVTPLGYNATSYVTLQSATGTNVQASIGGGAYVAIPASGTLLPIEPGQSISVRFTVGSTENQTYNAQIAIGVDAAVQTATFSATAQAGIFPNTFVVFPTYIPEVSSFTWADGSTNLSTVGCIELSLDGTTFTTTSTAVANGNTVYLRWRNTPICGGKTSGDITGSLTNGTYINSSTLSIQRVPNAFTFTDVSSAPLGSIVSSDPVVLTGITAPAYLTYDSDTSSLTNPQYSTDGGTTWASIPASGTSASVPPNASFSVRGKTGVSPTTAYSLDLLLGDGGTTTTTTWTATTTDAGVIQPTIDQILGVDGNLYAAPTEPSYVGTDIPGAVAPTTALTGLTPNALSNVVPAVGGSGTGLEVQFSVDATGGLASSTLSVPGSGYTYGEEVTFDLSGIGGGTTVPFTIQTQPVTPSVATFQVTDFQGVNAGVFASSEWEFDSDPSFPSPNVTTITTSGVSVSVDTELGANTRYYARFRYTSSTGYVSEYSPVVKSSTGSLLMLSYLMKSFSGTQFAGQSFNSGSFYITPKPYLYLVIVDNLGGTYGLDNGGTVSPGATIGGPARAGLYLQLRQPAYFEVTAVGANNGIDTLVEVNDAYGINDYYAAGAAATLTGGSGTGVTVVLSRDSEGKTTLDSIVTPGQNYQVGDILTFTPPIGNGSNYPGRSTNVTGFSEGTLDSYWDAFIHGIGGQGGGGSSSSGGAGGGYINSSGSGGSINVAGASLPPPANGGSPALSLYAPLGGAGTGVSGRPDRQGGGGGTGWGSGGGGSSDDNVNFNYTSGGGGGASYLNSQIVTNGQLSSTVYPDEEIDLYINGSLSYSISSQLFSLRIG